MRRMGWLLVLLVVAGWLASEVRLPETAATSAAKRDCWRRTRHGWEQATWLIPQVPMRRPALHPGVVGLLELLASTAALLAFPARRNTGKIAVPAEEFVQGHHIDATHCLSSTCVEPPAAAGKSRGRF